MSRAMQAAAILLILWCPPLRGFTEEQHEGHQPAPARSTAKPEPTPQPAKVLGWEPIRCWRQSSAGAVALGETFTVVLTCAVYEADNAQAVPDESRLGVASIQMAPFEILGGSHPPDVRRGSRRFIQYDYQLRIIGPDAIGRDVNIPPLAISYRIHSRVGAAGALEGRDLSYVMPMMPIKVLSLVPADASDIRDASEASLGAVESLRFRSSLFRVDRNRSDSTAPRLASDASQMSDASAGTSDSTLIGIIGITYDRSRPSSAPAAPTRL